MSIKLNRRKRIGFGVAAFAVVASGLPFASNTASAAPLVAGDPPAGVAIIAPNTVKTSATSFQLDLPAGASCPGNASTDGYRLYSYITPATVASDPAVFTYNTVTGQPSGPAFTSGLRNGGTNFAASQAININSPFGITFPAGGITLDFTTIPVPAGDYDMGIACTKNTNGLVRTERYWNATTTVVASSGAGPQNFIWGNPAAPAAPVITGPASVTTTSTSQVLSFTHAPSIPASTFTATVTGGAAVVDAAARTITVSGLALGTPATVSLTASNTIAPDASSNTVTTTRSAVIPPAVVATGVDGKNSGTVTWLAPASGPTPTGYTVRITGTNPVVAEQSFTVGNVLTSGPRALTVGTYSATVQASYAASEFITSPAISSPVTVRSNPDALITQEITVNRPNLNVLILTQRCGVNGPLDAEGSETRFPRDLPLEPASFDQIGTAPVGATPAQFDDYPLPTGTVLNPLYPTRCGLALGSARMITDRLSPLRGQFFTASGKLNQVTVADFRNADAGWTLSATMGDFSTTGDSFSGNYLGWTPAIPIVTPPVGGYTQTVTRGPIVLPGDGVPAFGGSGLGSGVVFARGAAVNADATSGGQGIADMNARVKLLIPVSANQGNYSGILTFTVI